MESKASLRLLLLAALILAATVPCIAVISAASHHGGSHGLTFFLPTTDGTHSAGLQCVTDAKCASEYASPHSSLGFILGTCGNNSALAALSACADGALLDLSDVMVQGVRPTHQALPAEGFQINPIHDQHLQLGRRARANAMQTGSAALFSTGFDSQARHFNLQWAQRAIGAPAAWQAGWTGEGER